jgi:hypothetical protein
MWNLEFGFEVSQSIFACSEQYHGVQRLFSMGILLGYLVIEHYSQTREPKTRQWQWASGQKKKSKSE